MTASTNGYKRQHGLTIEQQNAIDLLVTGMTDAATAEVVGVHRVTVTKWRLYDPWFRADLNRRRQDVWGAAGDRLRAMLPKAMDTIEQELEQGDAKTAVQVLKLAGLSALEPPAGPVEAEEIIEQQVTAMVEARVHEREKYQTDATRMLESIDPEHTRKRDEHEAQAAREEVLAGIESRLNGANG